MADQQSSTTPKSVKDLTGQVFGKLTVLAFSAVRPKLGAYWLCHCECGRDTVHRGADLRKGYITSCGCHKAQRLRAAATTHGLSHLPIYRRWCGMVQRCSDPNHIAYDNYGARGITVCVRWLSFENFYADMGEPPSKSHSIERRDNSKGYSPDNCYWATPSQQNRNTRVNHMLTFRGKTQCIADWADEIGIKYSVLYSRINRYEWSVDRALTTKVKLR